MLILVFLVRRFWPTGLRKRRAPEDGPNEEELFRQLEQTAREGDPHATYRTLMRWLDRFQADGSSPPLRGLIAAAGDPALAEQYAALESFLFGGEPKGKSSRWDGNALLAAVSRARRRLRAREQGEDRNRARLPSLNPRSRQSPPELSR